MKVILAKCSFPSWEESFETLQEAVDVLYSNICKTCLMTETEVKKNMEDNPEGGSDVVGMTFEEAYDEGLVEYIPDDWKFWDSHSQLLLLLGTPCGLEFEYRVED